MSVVTTRGATASRLDIPASGRISLLPAGVNRESFSRIAELVARFLGTARYLAIQTVVVIIWIGLNIALPFLRWDPYPFILLNLAFSTQAAYAAPLILLAQNRQDDRDRAALAEDRAGAARMKEDTEFLAREVAALRLAQGDTATRHYVRNEMAHQLEALKSDIESLLRETLASTAGQPVRSGTGCPEAAPLPTDRPTRLIVPASWTAGTARRGPAATRHAIRPPQGVTDSNVR